MIHEGFECEFYFIRHGESNSNGTPGIAAGENFDAAMTAGGYAQARALGERLREEGTTFDRVYSSTLQRASETAVTMLAAMNAANTEPVLVHLFPVRERNGLRRGRTPYLGPLRHVPRSGVYLPFEHV